MSKAGLIPKIADSIRSAETQEDKLAILSNGTPALLNELVKSNNLENIFLNLMKFSVS